MEVLVYLASRQGEVVTREALEREVWRGALVGYDAVTSTVIKLRKALGDSARNSSVIRTIPKRGYQLIASVGPADDVPGGRDFVAPARPEKKSRLYTQAALLVLVGIGFWLLMENTSEPEHPKVAALESDASRTPSIVVLPFENLSEDPAQEHFADGITEDIITDLSGLSGLLVFASNTSFSYKDRKVTAQEVGMDLDVGFVLEGSIRRHGNSVRVNAQLVDNERSPRLLSHRQLRLANTDR